MEDKLIAAAVAAFLGGNGGGGGGEPAQYLKTISKDTENEEITITDKNGNETTFPYGSSSSPIIEVDTLPTTDIVDMVYYHLSTDGSYNIHFNNEWLKKTIYQYEWSDGTTTLELSDSKEV